MKIRVGMLWNIVKSGLLGFFLAGAVVFPIIEPYYLPRVLLTLGLFGIGYGLNSVLTFGHVTTSGMLSGHDTVHDVRIFGFILWLLLFAYFTRRDRRSRSDA
jgi:hypothetical protein